MHVIKTEVRVLKCCKEKRNTGYNNVKFELCMLEEGEKYCATYKKIYSWVYQQMTLLTDITKVDSDTSDVLNLKTILWQSSTFSLLYCSRYIIISVFWWIKWFPIQSKVVAPLLKKIPSITARSYHIVWEKFIVKCLYAKNRIKRT